MWYHMVQLPTSCLESLENPSTLPIPACSNENNNYNNNNENNKGNDNGNNVVSCFQTEVLLSYIDRPFWNRQMINGI